MVVSLDDVGNVCRAICSCLLLCSCGRSPFDGFEFARMMLQLRLTVIAIFVYLTCAQAVVLLTHPASRTQCLDHRTSIRAAAPTVTHRAELRKRQSSSSAIEPACGYSDSNTLYCNDGLNCRATIFAGGPAFGYCETPGASSQFYQTEAYASFSENYPGDDCPEHAECWYVHLNRYSSLGALSYFELCSDSFVVLRLSTHNYSSGTIIL